jgi:hypothetical protein
LAAWNRADGMPDRLKCGIFVRRQSPPGPREPGAHAGSIRIQLRVQIELAAIADHTLEIQA